MAFKTKPQAADDVLSLTVIGIDIGKDIFHIVGFDPSGKIVLRRKLRRLSLEAEFEKFPRCIVGIEACLSTHFVRRSMSNPSRRARRTITTTPRQSPKPPCGRTSISSRRSPKSPFLYRSRNLVERFFNKLKHFLERRGCCCAT
jgi:hypothetical protein